MAAEHRDKPTALYFDPLVLDHDPGPGHPETPTRLTKIVDVLQQSPMEGVVWKTPRAARMDELTAVHDPSYVARVAALSGQSAVLDEDTVLSPGSWRAAELAAGAAVAAVEDVWTGTYANAFALARPPGHHAEAAQAMGFCLINNAAVAAEAARRLGAARVAIVDWDVHHGNGTQHIFEDRADVMYVSVHQFPLYPGTGAVNETGRGAGSGLTVNCPLPPGQDDAAYGAVFEEVFLPALDRFRPEVLIVSAGFDAHAFDPLASMRVTERGFAAMCAALRDVADRHAAGRFVLLLEGGYHLNALANSVRGCVEVLRGATDSFPSGVSREAADAVAAAQQALADSGVREG